LIAAVMESAVYEFRKARSDSMRHGTDSEDERFKTGNRSARHSYSGRWIFGEGARPFGFNWCCSVLDLHPERVRDALLNRRTFRGKYAVKLKAHNS
jgi:hypothetical protein